MTSNNTQEITEKIKKIRDLIPKAENEDVRNFLMSELDSLLSMIGNKQDTIEENKQEKPKAKSTIYKEKHKRTRKKNINIAENILSGRDELTIKSFHLKDSVLDELYNKVKNDKQPVQSLLRLLKIKFLDEAKTDDRIMNMIKKKVYVQFKFKVQFFHDKYYCPGITTTNRVFYVEKFNDRSNLVQDFSDLPDIYDRQMNIILNKIKEFEDNGSDWVFKEPLKFTMRLILYHSSFSNSKIYIPTPDWLKDRKAVINIKNTDDNCGYKSIYRALCPDKYRHDYRDVSMDVVNEYFRSNNIDVSMFSQGFVYEAFRKFEEVNKIGINVYYIGMNGPEETEQDYVSMYLGNKDFSEERIINLGYLEQDGKSHFVIIKKLHLVLHEKYTNNHSCVCSLCNHKYSRPESLLRHIRKYHENHNKLPDIKLPSKDSPKAICKYDPEKPKWVQRSRWYPFVVYADFEASNIRYDDGTVVQVPNSYTMISPELLDVKHTPLKLQTCIKRFHSSDPDKLMLRFVEDLYNLHTSHLYKLQEHPNVPELTEEEQKIYDETKECPNCNRVFGNKYNGQVLRKVRHHDHITGKFISALCIKCNFNECWKNFKTRVVFHNLKGYDSHFLIRYAFKYICKEGCVDDDKPKKDQQYWIGKSMEKFSYIGFGPYIFMDSYCHLSSSLDRLVQQLKAANVKFELCDKFNVPECLRKKLLYPYSAVSDIEEMFDKSPILPIEAFYNDLKGKPCKQHRYDSYLQLVKERNYKNFGELHYDYLLSDVVLLAEVFTHYRKVCMENYSLDPAQFPTSPSFTIANFLKRSRVELELITDIDMFHFISSALRGGMCSVGEINFSNVYNRKGYHIIGFDMNSLYPTVMRFPLPKGEFQWVSVDEGIRMLSEYKLTESEYGYYLEVDIEVPKEIHDYVSAYPLFPERSEKFGNKLVATLYPKKNYVSHIANLQLGLDLGYKITNVHRVLKFRQERFMKDYIDHLCAERKKYPKGTFYNEYYKLLANSLFGKTCENPYKYRKFRFATGYQESIRLLNNNRLRNFHKLKSNDKPLVLAELDQDEIYYDKPMIIGATILELSKWYMQYCYYFALKVYYGDRMKFIYTDTDSLVLELQTEDPEKDIRSEDLSCWFENKDNKGTPGVLKIEKKCIEFKAFCPKHYYYISNMTEDERRFLIEKAKKKNMSRDEINYISNIKYKFNEAFKGIPKHARTKISDKDIEDHLKKNSPKEPGTKVFTSKQIRSKKHEIFVVNQTKEINDNDDKRYYLEDGIHTLAWGHYRIEDKN
jgi:hypothetical protein